MHSQPGPILNSREILEQADTCVKCGLCIPHCPTYRKCANEAESPRGRVALIQGLIGGGLADTDVLRAHLDRCLECRACENACPSGVPVTSLVDAAKARRNAGLPRLQRGLRLLLLRLAARPRVPMALLRAYRSSGLQLLLRASRVLALSPRLRRAEGLLPPPPARMPIHVLPSNARAGGRVNLFPGCVSRHLDRAAHDAAVLVLSRLGFAVRCPSDPCCCGALYRHDGFPAQAERELGRVARLFAGAPLLTLASACHGELLRAPALVGQVEEITRFLADLSWPEDLVLRPLLARVWVHTPCTQRNTLGDPDAALDLLRRIPGVRLASLPDNDLCCGAAGTYLLRQPSLADALLEDKLVHVRSAPPDFLVTTNTGCALHLAAGIRAAALKVQVCHPVELIARQLDAPLESV
jgi:glycolate oxidase iron-sulfur subunit